MIFIFIYIDDILIVGTYSDSIDQLIVDFNIQFTLKDLSLMHYFLGVEAWFIGDCLYLSQQKYIKDMLESIGMIYAKPTTTPTSLGNILNKYNGQSLSDASMYQRLIVSLQYLTLTWLNILFVVNNLYQFLSYPTDIHWLATKRLLCYLKGKIYFDVTLFKSATLDILAYCDANYANCPDEHRNTGSYCVFLGKCLIPQHSSKQKVVSCSSNENKYRALSIYSTKIIQLSSLLVKLHCLPSSVPLLLTDNIST